MSGTVHQKRQRVIAWALRIANAYNPVILYRNEELFKDIPNIYAILREVLELDTQIAELKGRQNRKLLEVNSLLHREYIKTKEKLGERSK